ncbi:MAG: GAF domain-containing protein [Spirochaeta sp.]|nr:GAF domain-containing protein [Spirochaeta sp.]
MQVKTGGDSGAGNDGASNDGASNEKVVSRVLGAQKGLLDGTPVEDAIPAALGAVGAAVGADRAYVFAFRSNAEGTIYGSQRYEWVAPGVAPEIDNPVLQDIPMYEAGYGRWVDHFRRCDLVYGSLVDFPPSEHESLAAQGIMSLVVIPIYVNAALWGFVGFDDCSRSRSWSAPEIDLLLSLSISIGAALVHDLYADDSSENGPAGFSGLLSGYTAIVTSLAESAELDDHCDCGPNAMTVLRLGLIVRVHAILQEHFEQPSIDLSYGLRELYDHLVVAVRTRNESLRLRLDVAPVYVSPDALPSLGMIVTEILAGISCNAVDGHPGAAVIKLGPTEHGAEISVAVEDTSGKVMTSPGLLDSSKILLIRRLAEHSNAQVSYGDGYVARFRFPVHTQA